MATMYISEFAAIGGTGNFVVSGAQQTPIAEQTVAIGANTQSNTFNTKTMLIRLNCDSICSVEFGTNPAATTSKMRMAANQTEYFTIPPNSGWKLAVISNT